MRKKILIICIIILVVILIGTGSVIVKTILDRKSSIKIDKEKFGVTETENEIQENNNIDNIVFLGIDWEENRSDVIMILSINKTENTANVISILRDTRVDIEGHAPTKLGYAYKWGGATLTLKTINQNFGTDFYKYVAMDFTNMVNIIDYIGGVDVELTEEEANIINEEAQATGYNGYDAVEGWNTLNGSQAVAYSRIRKIDSEYYRAGRQQTVIKAMLAKIKKLSVTQYPGLINLVSSGLETNLFYDDLFSYLKMDIDNIDLKTYTIPDAEYDENLFGGWVENKYDDPSEDEIQWLWIYDLDKASQRMKDIMNGIIPEKTTNGDNSEWIGDAKYYNEIIE